MKNKYVLGLDIGISSVGWGMLALDDQGKPYRIIDTGVKIFLPGENVKTGESKNLNRRAYRGVRRINRRRSFRTDRIKFLLNQNGYLGTKVVEQLVSDSRNKIQNIFLETITNYYLNNNKNPYNLKVEALDRKLTKEELSIILVHYAKHRGYKSNRTEDSSSNSETGKVLKNIAENEILMKEKKYRTVSEMYLEDEKFSDKIRNSSDEYKTLVTRDMNLNEIEKVLDCQIKYGLIDEKFKSEYIKIWGDQRNFATGPGGDSPYGGDLIAKMTGKCTFDGNPRAPKCSPTAELFVQLSKITNLKYKSGKDGNYQKISEEQISQIINLLKTKDTVTYNNIASILDKENIYFKDLTLSKKEYSSFIENIKKKLKLDQNKKIILSELKEEELKLYEKEYNKKLNSKNFIELKNYSIIRKKFISCFGTEKWNTIYNDFIFFDNIAIILTNYKDNNEIIKKIEEYNIDETYIDFILGLPNMKDHIMLSLNMVNKIIPYMLKGYTYDKSMELAGYNHTNINSNIDEQFVKLDLLKPINEDFAIKNQRVLRSLSQTRKVINSIIKKYGLPEQINIETARELAKTAEERRKIEKNQLENKDKNIEIKNHLFSLFPNLFKSADNISSSDLLKYKLWKEQNETCMYSLEHISIEELFEKNFVQIDHILPYSRTFNDNYLNKTLVKSKYNQEKGNLTPYEWFGKTDKWNKFVLFVNSLAISEKKKDNYLLKDLTFEIENEMREQNLNDTKYISKYLTSYLKAYLNVNKIKNVNGMVTAKLRGFWGLNNLTHSLEAKNYYNSQKEKNRNNHLHHATDALIIAATNDSLIQQITRYEKYKRYINGKTLKQLKEYGLNEGILLKNSNNYHDMETGEQIEDIDLKDYIKEMRDKHYLKENKNHTFELLFPKPYENFSKEIKARIYERDIEIMKKDLKDLGYTIDDLNNITPIIPVQSKQKSEGGFHKDTFYGIRKNQEGIKKTERISIVNSNFKLDKLDKIIDKDGGSKAVYDTLKIWLGTSDGQTAFKDKGYPINPKTGNLIKKIKIENEYDGKGHIIDNNKIVEKENIYIVKIYKSKNITDEKLYFVGYDAFDLIKIRKGIDIPIMLWYGPGNSKYNKNYSELNIEYDEIISLRKKDLVKITKLNGRSGIAYIVGFTSGMLEVMSVLGDGYDLIGQNNLFDRIMDRYKITVSTISSIKLLKLNTLGKIE